MDLLNFPSKSVRKGVIFKDSILIDDKIMGLFLGLILL